MPLLQTRRRLMRVTLPLIIVGAIAMSQAALADSNSPVGDWRVIDDTNNKPIATVRISQAGHTLIGTIVQTVDPPNPPTCTACTGDRKDKPIIGLQIMRGLRWNGTLWDGGSILDPETGKIYGCQISVEDGGQHLKVHGFLGVPLLGRTQTWDRVN